MNQESRPPQQVASHFEIEVARAAFDECVANADADVIEQAMNAEKAELVEKIQASSQNENLQKRFDRDVKQLGRARYMLHRWQKDLAREPENTWEDFPTYINAYAEVAIEADSFEDEAIYAKEWLDKGNYYKGVSDVLRSKEAAEDKRQQGVYSEATSPASKKPEQLAYQQARAISEAQQSVEKAHRAEVFTEVLRYADNGTHLNTDVFGGFKSFGDGPVNERGKETLDHNLLKEVERKNKDWRMHLNEVVAFTDVVGPEYREETVERVIEPGGIFKRAVTRTETVQVAVPGSEKQRTIINDETGVSEPMVRFRYRFKYSTPASKSGELPRYSEFMGMREGQQVCVAVDLPQSVSARLREQVAHDPESIRGLVEQLFLEHNGGVMSETEWRNGGEQAKNPIRPPYEALPKDWNIAVVTGTEYMKYSSGSYGYIENAAIQRQVVHG